VFRTRPRYLELLGFFYAETWELHYGLRSSARSGSELAAEVDRLHDLAVCWGEFRAEHARTLATLGRLDEELAAGARALAPGAGSRRAAARFETFEAAYLRILEIGRPDPAVRHFAAWLELAVESQAGIDPALALPRLADGFRFANAQVRLLRGLLRDAGRWFDARYERGGEPQ
jgi:hypothetical protein